MPKINQEEYEKIKLLPNYDWNWIAREKTGKILSFTNKPTKTDEVWKDKQTRLWFNYKDSQLFQFIQWEDEEPYEISELIREYEIKELRLAPSGTVIVDSFDESEETLKLELVDGKYKLSKKTNNTWNFMLLSEAELKQILKLIEREVTK